MIEPKGLVQSASERPTIKIGLLWHSLNSGNLGVGALTASNLAIAASAAHELGLRAEFNVMGMRDNGVPLLLPDVSRIFVLTMRSLVSPWGFWRQLRTVDCVLDIGAGDSFAEIYGPKRFMFLWLTKAMAIWRGVPLVLSPQTIGPFTKPAYRALANWTMSRASAVIARDTQSFDALKEIAPKAKAALAVDVAFKLPFIDNSADRLSASMKIGINVSGLLFHEAETRRNRFGLSYDYASVIRRLIGILVQRENAEVYLISHATSLTDPQDDDGRCAAKLAQEFPAAIRVADFCGPSEAKSYISGLNFLIAGRMHACIAAYSSGTPVVPMAYSRKFSGLFGMLKYPWLVPVSGMTDEDVVEYLLAAIEKRERLSGDIKIGMRSVEMLLDNYDAVLTEIFNDFSETMKLGSSL